MLFLTSDALAMKNSISMDNSDQKLKKTKLKKFLTRRPTLQAVKDKGYIKGSALELINTYSIWWTWGYSAL